MVLGCCMGARVQGSLICAKSLFCAEDGSRKLPASEGLKYIAKVTSASVHLCSKLRDYSLLSHQKAGFTKNERQC